MHSMTQSVSRLARWLAVGMVAVLGLAGSTARARAEGVELIPSVGLQRAIKGSDQVKPYYGLALRAKILPMLKGEVAGAYRTDDFSTSSGDFTVKSWPVTASLWLAPLSSIYVGGGVGWYNQSFEFAPSVGQQNRTRQDFGMHVGGGLDLPLAPKLGVDLNGRYVFLPVKNDPVDVLKDWNPSYWTTSIGLSLRF